MAEITDIREFLSYRHTTISKIRMSAIREPRIPGI